MGHALLQLRLDLYLFLMLVLPVALKIVLSNSFAELELGSVGQAAAVAAALIGGVWWPTLLPMLVKFMVTPEHALMATSAYYDPFRRPASEFEQTRVALNWHARAPYPQLEELVSDASLIVGHQERLHIVAGPHGIGKSAAANLMLANKPHVLRFTLSQSVEKDPRLWPRLVCGAVGMPVAKEQIEYEYCWDVLVRVAQRYRLAKFPNLLGSKWEAWKTWLYRRLWIWEWDDEPLTIIVEGMEKLYPKEAHTPAPYARDIAELTQYARVVALASGGMPQSVTTTSHVGVRTSVDYAVPLHNSTILSSWFTQVLLDSAIDPQQVNITLLVLCNAALPTS